MGKNRFVFHFVLATLLVMVFFGCGKKGPPLPPDIKGKTISAPFDLKYTSNDNEIRLAWNHKIDTETAFVKPAGFEVFMAKKTFEACEGCPFEFEMINFVQMPSTAFSRKLEKGFKYYFRVQAVDDDNMRSEYSKTVQFEYK